MIIHGSFTLKQNSFRIKSFSCKVFDLPITQCVLSTLPSVFLYRTYMDSSHAGNHCGYSFIQRLLRKTISEYQNGTWKNLPGKIIYISTKHQFVWIPSQCPTNYPPKNYTTKLLQKWWKMTISFLGWHIFRCQVWRISNKRTPLPKSFRSHRPQPWISKQSFPRTTQTPQRCNLLDFFSTKSCWFGNKLEFDQRICNQIFHKKMSGFQKGSSYLL